MRLRKMVAPDEDGRCPACRDRLDLSRIAFIEFGKVVVPPAPPCEVCGRKNFTIEFCRQAPRED
jgi:hypothetical protein